MTTEHHTQKVDFGENGYLEATGPEPVPEGVYQVQICEME